MLLWVGSVSDQNFHLFHKNSKIQRIFFDIRVKHVSQIRDDICSFVLKNSQKIRIFFSIHKKKNPKIKQIIMLTKLMLVLCKF